MGRALIKKGQKAPPFCPARLKKFKAHFKVRHFWLSGKKNRLDAAGGQKFIWSGWRIKCVNCSAR